MSDSDEKIALLDSLRGQMTEADAKFADNLINGQWGYRRRGYLSPRQWPWVDKLIERVQNPRETPKCDANLAGVKAFLMNAKRSLKFPKVWLRTEDGRDLKIYVAGDRSRVPNAVNFVLYDQEQDGWREDHWLGRVLDNGDWHQPRNVEAGDIEQVMPLLRGLGDDPHTVAAHFGKLTGRCCFCNRALSDQDKSTKVGYGPTCAKKYGLHDQWKAAGK